MVTERVFGPGSDSRCRRRRNCGHQRRPAGGDIRRENRAGRHRRRGPLYRARRNLAGTSVVYYEPLRRERSSVGDC